MCLEAVATLEQSMATGEDSSGKAFKTALPELKALLQRSDLPLSPEDKMRLLMMCPPPTPPPSTHAHVRARAIIARR